MDRRGLLIALVASLALNLFLVAAGVSIWVINHRVITPATVQAIGLRRAAGALNPHDKQAFLTLLKSEGAAVRPSNRQARALRDGAWAAVADGALTADAIKQRLADAQALNQVTRRRVEGAVVDFALALPPAERHALGEALRPRLTPPAKPGATP